MPNPWLKKNPFLSIWLSGFNAAAGAARSHAAAEVRRRASTAMTQATRDILNFWTAGFRAPATKTHKRKPRKRR